MFFCDLSTHSKKAANKTNTSVHVGYFQQLSADVAKEGANLTVSFGGAFGFLLVNNHVGSLITKYAVYTE